MDSSEDRSHRDRTTPFSIVKFPRTRPKKRSSSESLSTRSESDQMGVDAALTPARDRQRRGASEYDTYILEVECEAHVNSSRHLVAIEKLYELHSLQPDDIKTMLMLAECFLKVDRPTECFEILKKIQRVILEEPRPDVYHMISQARMFKDSSRFASLVFLWSCCAVYEADYFSKNVLEGVNKCLQEIDNMTLDTFDAMFAENYKPWTGKVSTVFRYMIDDIETRVEKVWTNEKCLRTEVLLHCSACRAYWLCRVGRCGEAIDLLNHCVRVTHKTFQRNSSKMVMYGDFLYSLGHLYRYRDTSDFQSAVRTYRKAYYALQESEPNTEEEKSRAHNAMKWLEVNLEQARRDAPPPKSTPGLGVERSQHRPSRIPSKREGNPPRPGVEDGQPGPSRSQSKREGKPPCPGVEHSQPGPSPSPPKKEGKLSKTLKFFRRKRK